LKTKKAAVVNVPGGAKAAALWPVSGTRNATTAQITRAPFANVVVENDGPHDT
jgi:hypothetical protein